VTEAYKECLLDSSCDRDCPSVVPTAPSPVSFFPPVLISDDDFLGDDFASPECADESQAYDDCFLQNFLCFASCLEGSLEDDNTGPDEDICEYFSQSCDEISCCAECIPQGKAYAACEANVNGCAEDCSDLAPAAPSPIAPSNLFGPVATSPFAFPPIGAPAFTTEGDDFASPECANASQAYDDCFSQNIFVCGGCFLEGDDDTGADEDLCEFLSQFCDELSCCAVCIPQAKVYLACEAKVNGCAEVCSDLAPAAPSPIAPFAPFNFFGPVASSPSAFLPIASPVSPGFAPVAPPIQLGGGGEEEAKGGKMKGGKMKGGKKSMTGGGGEEEAKGGKMKGGKKSMTGMSSHRFLVGKPSADGHVRGTRV
jgi:hypothetical protein